MFNIGYPFLIVFSAVFGVWFLTLFIIRSAVKGDWIDASALTILLVVLVLNVVYFNRRLDMVMLVSTITACLVGVKEYWNKDNK